MSAAEAGGREGRIGGNKERLAVEERGGEGGREGGRE